MRDLLLLAAAALVAFGLSVGGSFHYDDYALFNDPAVTSFAATRPLTNATFQLNEWIGGRDPAGYHLVNLLLHLAAVLLLRATLALILPPPVALTAALIFAVHPIASEPVNYVFARGTLLATLLSIASLNSWLKGRHWIAVLWFAAALLAKEECVAFPVFLILLALSAPLKRRQEIAPICAMLALALAAGLRVLAATSAISGTALGFGSRMSPLEYLSTQGIAILRYLWLVIAPWGFTVDTALPVPALGIRAAAWIAVIVLAALATRGCTRVRPGFWFLGALILLLPSSSIFPSDDLSADRRMYLPMAALSAFLALVLMRLDRRAVALVLIILTGISIRYSYVWQTERRLWSEAVERAPGKARPRVQLARTAGSPAESLRILDDAEKIAPGDATVASEQGRMLLALGRPADALSAFGRALALAPRDAAALSNRGAALASLGQTYAARQDFNRALSINPCLFDARVNLKRMGVPVMALPAQCRYTPEQEAQLQP